jgi:hypothetical protein
MTFNFAGRHASLGLAACLGHGAKMPRLCFYNQRFASRAPGVDITSGDCSPSAAGNPPAFDAQPRAAACLTARGPASVRSTASAGAFSASGGSVDRDPLTPLVQRPAWNTASRIPFQSPDPGLPRARQWRAASPGSRCLPSRETARSALARARRFALLRLAGRRICRASSSMCKTSTRPLLGRFRGREEATRAPAISAGGCLHEHDCGPLEHPDPRISRAGRLPCSVRKLPSVRDSHRRCSRSGAEQPMLGILGHDCACPRLRPNPDRSEHLVSQDVIPGRSGATR